MATIADRAGEVILALGNRQDVGFTNRVYKWLMSAYLEIGMAVNFEEQEDSYSDQFVPNGDTYQYRDQDKAIKAIVRMELDGSNPKRLSKKDIINIRMQDKTRPGPPLIWAPENRVIHVRAVPDKAYIRHMTVWLKPQQADTIQDTELLVADDWLEVIDYGAMMRGHTALLERNKALEVRQILYGDPKHPADKGLIERKKLERQAGAQAEEWGIKPRIHRYTNVP